MTSNHAASERSSLLFLLQLKRIFTLVAGLLLLPTIAIAAGPPQTLVSVGQGSLPPISGNPAISHVLVVDGRLVALTDTAAWIFNEPDNTWTRSRGPSAGDVTATAMATAAADAQSFVVLRDPDGLASRVARLALLRGELVTRELPVLPAALQRPLAAVRGTRLYVAGVTPEGASRLFAYETAGGSEWSTQAGWPGAAAEMTSLSAQTFAVFITLAGDAQAGQRGDRMFRWTEDEGWSERIPVPGFVDRATSSSIGQAHVLYLLRLPGAARVQQLWSYHTITGSWARLADVTDANATGATAWKNGIAWLNWSEGRGREIAFAQLQSRGHLLHWLDWIVIVVYLLSMLGMGLYFYLKEKRNSTADFFVGGRSIPFWAAGISLYAANTSSISYIAIPAKAFETNWQYLMNNLCAVVGLMFVAVWIVPLLRRLNLMSVFTYLETRFHPLIRTMSSALFMAVQIGSRMSVILFLPSLAISTVLDIPVSWSILIMGVFTMIYTALGGMKAVVWTDFVQLIVKMGGIAFAIAFIVFMLDGGSGELFSIALAEEKMKLLDFRFDLTRATVWGFIFLVLFDVVLTFPKDQVLMQRVLSTKNDRDAGRSIWTFAAVMIPGGFMFYFTGTALYAFYKTHPERLDPLLNIDATFPLFIAAELPLGVKGLIIAGILAAAMATLSSIMNSVATLASVDFYEKIVRKPDPKVSVRFAEAMTIVTGLLGMGVALLLSGYDIHSLFDVSIELAGLLGGGFAGAYTLGMFTRRANWQGVMIGVAVSITLTTIAWSMSLVHPYFYLGISIMLCICVGYVASYLFPPPSAAQLAGTTIHGENADVRAVAPAE
jgi:SSS family solute:Na+ symporter